MHASLAKLWRLSILVGTLALGARTAVASTGVCDSNPPTSTSACINAVQSSGGVVNDIFRDAAGRTVDQLPLFGQVFDVFPQCGDMNCAGCNPGVSLPPYDCPGAGTYTCTSKSASNPATLASLGDAMNAVDRRWGHPCRLANPPLANGCPDYSQCIPDGTGGRYLPWESVVFDLGGPSNQVAIFAMNDHGPQPCESLEYTVFLTDDPHSQDIVLHPTTTGADPKKWNRAVLSKIYTEGFASIRQPDPTDARMCGDTPVYAVEEDSFVQVFALPCGITFRYAAIVAGNDGLDFPACAFDSSEAELDGVAGLTEDGTAVCPDADRDGFVDCNCKAAPPKCDCNDADPHVHPGAPEKCDDPDVNCDGVPGSCPPGLVCNASICVASCAGSELTQCPPGATCQSTDRGKLCVPTDCTGGCPAGSVCDTASGACKPACEGVVCPGAEVCRDGACVDPCAGVVCPNQQVCSAGTCAPRCGCFQGDVGCPQGSVCDTAGQGQCVDPGCQGVTCPSSQVCKQGNCVSICAGVSCPRGERCDDTAGACVPLCQGVTCPTGETCDPADGTCKSTTKPCQCLLPAVCDPDSGACVTPDGGADGSVDASLDASDASDGGSSPRKPQVQNASDDPSATSGCGCRAAGGGASGAAAASIAMLLALSIAARRRRDSE